MTGFHTSFYTCDDCECQSMCLRRQKCSRAEPLPLHRPLDVGNTFKGGLEQPEAIDSSAYGWWKCPTCKQSNTYMRKYYNPQVPHVCAFCPKE